uniref:Cytosolic iron-sulfur protein assembly protein CIAO1 homolog n=1 Tax=Kalanchoe fedtschenkoi TaxID=63787 RepID=A0A7N1A4J6_KALFE
MVKWHPSMDILFSCSYDNTIKVWAEDDDGDDWRCVQTLNESNNGHTSTVWALSFNSTGDNMVSCSDDLTIKIWGADAGDGYSSWEGVIATGAGDDTIRLFTENKDDMIDGSMYKLLLKKEKAHSMDVNSVQWSYGEKRLLASASDDMTIKIWELACIP